MERAATLAEVNPAAPSTTPSPDGPARPGARVHPLVWILLAAAVLRLALWDRLGNATLAVWDERDYHALGTNLADRGEFAVRPGEPTSIRPPLYPLAVSAVYRVAGTGNVRAVYFAQAAVALLGVLLIYRLGAALYDRRVGLLAAALCAFYPSLLAYDTLLLTETLFTTLLVATCLPLVHALRHGSATSAALGGVLLGLAALTRSVLWIFPLAFVPFLLAATRGGPGRRLATAACFLAAFVATLAPWAARNTRLQRTFTTVDVMGGRNFMMGNYEHTPNNRAWNAIAIGGERSWYRVLAAAHPDYDDLTQGQRDKLALRAAIRFVLEHPALTLRRDLVKFFNFWGLERELIAGAAQGDRRLSGLGLLALTALIFGSFAAATLLGLFGALVTPPADWRGHALLLLIIAFITGMHTLSFGHSRYHLPLMPLVLIYAAQATLNTREIWGRRRRRTFVLASGLALVLAAAWATEALVVDLQRYLHAIRDAA